MMNISIIQGVYMNIDAMREYVSKKGETGIFLGIVSGRHQIVVYNGTSFLKSKYEVDAEDLHWFISTLLPEKEFPDEIAVASRKTYPQPSSCPVTEKNGNPIVKIESLPLDEHEYDDGTNIYHYQKLIEHSKNYPVFEIPIAAIDLSTNPWGKATNIFNFVYHVKRMNETDLSYPIILDDYGIICDGWHRVAKALIEGRTTIKAIRLEEMPNPDRKSELKKQPE